MTPGDLFILERGLESQQNGWVHAVQVGVEKSIAPHGWIPAAGVEKDGNQATVVRSAGSSGGGYLTVTAGDKMVVMHIEGAWVYGYKAVKRQPDLDLRGWFPRATLVPAPKR
jgi:hypothetical protein